MGSKNQEHLWAEKKKKKRKHTIFCDDCRSKISKEKHAQWDPFTSFGALSHLLAESLSLSLSRCMCVYSVYGDRGMSSECVSFYPKESTSSGFTTFFLFFLFLWNLFFFNWWIFFYELLSVDWTLHLFTLFIIGVFGYDLFYRNWKLKTENIVAK